jgi:tetratricopeptide (TPR) repeat protein
MSSEDEVLRKIQALIDKDESWAEIARRFGDDPRPAIRIKVAGALCAKGDWSEGSDVYDEVVRRYGDDPLPDMQEKVNEALWKKAGSLEYHGFHRKAVTVYEQIMRRNEARREMAIAALAAQCEVLEALATYGDEEETGSPWRDKIERLSEKLGFDPAWKKARKAMAANDEIVRRYAGDPHPDIQNEVGGAFFRKGGILCRHRRFADAVRVYDELLRRHGNIPPSPPGHGISTRRWRGGWESIPDCWEMATKASLYKGALLKLLGRLEEANAAFDEFERRFDGAQQAVEAYFEEVDFEPREAALAILGEAIRRHGEDASPGIRKPMLAAFVKKARTLRELVEYENQVDRFAATIAAYDEIVRRYGEDRDIETRRIVAKAMFDKGCAFHDRKESAIAAYDEAARRHGDETDVEIRRTVAEALLYKCRTLAELGKPGEAVAVSDEIARRFGKDSDVELRVNVIKAMKKKGNLLGGHEEIAVFDEILRSCDESEEDSDYRCAVAEVLYEKGVALAEQGRFKEALDVFEEYEQGFDDTINSNHRQQLAEAKENAARGKSCGSRGRLGIVTYE